MQNSQLVKNYHMLKHKLFRHLHPTICLSAFYLHNFAKSLPRIFFLWDHCSYLGNHNTLATVFARCMSLFFPIRGAIESWNFSLFLALLSQHILMFYMKVPYIEPFIIAPHHMQFYFYREHRWPCCQLAPWRSLFFSVSVFFPSKCSFEVFFPFLEIWLFVKTGWVGKRCREN